MKTKLLILAIAAFAFVGTTAYAQSAEESVKILRTSKPGIIKLHYAMETSELVKVKFINENGVVGSDKIKGEYPNGLSKKYDVRHIDDREFWIEVSSPGVSLTYHITPSKGGLLTASLEKTTYNQQLVKANN
jgi:hypothetical protein